MADALRYPFCLPGPLRGTRQLQSSLLMKALLTSLCLLSALPLAACGDDDDGRPAPYQSGVQASGPVSDLEDKDLQRICNTFDTHLDVSLGYDAIAHVLCLPQALLLGGSREGCEKRMADCKRDLPPPAMISVAINDNRTCVNNLRQCNATIAQVEACVNVNVDWAFDIVKSFTCGDVANEQRRQVANGAAGCVNVSPGCERFADVQSETPLF